jgi:hypothetical protein
MKKVFLFSLLSLCSLLFVPCSTAQGNLQFNQVKLVSTVETVPTGKVWKVESATYAGGSIFCVGGGPTGGTVYCTLSSNALQNYSVIGIMSYSINGQPNYISDIVYSNSISAQLSPFPFWLPASSTLAVGTSMRYLSVIEFNIIP